RGGRLVERLEQAAAEHARIDHRPARQEERCGKIAIDAAEPFLLAEKIEADRVLRIDQRLGFAVAALLADIGFDRVAAEMPDHGRRAEADRVARILEAP